MALVNNGILPRQLLETTLVSNDKLIGSEKDIEMTIGNFVTEKLFALLRRALVTDDSCGGKPLGKLIDLVGKG